MQKNKLMIIDDELDFLHFLRLNLEKTGKYTLYTSSDPVGALRHTGIFKPDLALVDIS
jgi:hypothetical protein